MVERHRSECGIHAAAIGQAQVGHRGTGVDPPADSRRHPLDHPDDVLLVEEADARFLETPIALDVDLVVAIHEHVTHCRVRQQGGQWTKSQCLVDEFGGESVAFMVVHRKVLNGDRPGREITYQRRDLLVVAEEELSPLDLVDELRLQRGLDRGVGRDPLGWPDWLLVDGTGRRGGHGLDADRGLRRQGASEPLAGHRDARRSRSSSLLGAERPWARPARRSRPERRSPPGCPTSRTRRSAPVRRSAADGAFVRPEAASCSTASTISRMARRKVFIHAARRASGSPALVAASTLPSDGTVKSIERPILVRASSLVRSPRKRRWLRLSTSCAAAPGRNRVRRAPAAVGPPPPRSAPSPAGRRTPGRSHPAPTSRRRPSAGRYRRSAGSRSRVGRRGGARRTRHR